MTFPIRIEINAETNIKLQTNHINIIVHIKQVLPSVKGCFDPRPLAIKFEFDGPQLKLHVAHTKTKSRTKTKCKLNRGEYE